ncbi:hypothetical protein NLU13_3019 [Sarocladium strictum]|uniref:WHIM1 domain-containing protein n=1 Tax=Sarocladium strictum TaxID=5046 RepID=A0AA39GM21_SARSR|nr:hypothetical protein NLU13_3019 [Sarocladium strictum]
MPSGDESSDLSSLSSLSPAPSHDELDDLSDAEPSRTKSGILKFFPKLSEQPPREPSPPPRKRSPSPPHEYVLADNPDIAFIVMFRNRFSDAFPKSLAHFGPQELERDVVEAIPGDRVEHFLCALLGLLLNRKQDVKPGHYGRALEDAIASHKSQWAKEWEDKSPLSGGASFNTMNPTQRLLLLRMLILWTMAASDTVKSLINQSYKQNRHDDDLNQPRSVQPWGTDGDKRRYFLIEGLDDTNFRVYRESNPAGTNRTWWSVAGSIDEIKALAEKLDTKDGGPKAKKLSHKMLQALPRFEAGEEKRKRRDYRQMQKERFKRPEPGFSMYEGRTRGKRIKYTYSDDEDMVFSDSTQRRSARNTGTTTPAETGPTTTSSGRQVRAPTRLNVDESGPGSIQGDNSEHDHEDSVGPNGRPRRAAAPTQGANGWPDSRRGSRRNDSADSDDDGTEAEFGDDEEDVDAHVPEESEEEDEFDEDEAMVDDDIHDEPQSLMVKLSVTPPKLRTVLLPNTQAVNYMPTADGEDTKPQTQNGSINDTRNGGVGQSDGSIEHTKPNVSAEALSKADGPADKNSRPIVPDSVVSAPPSEPQEAILSATPLAYRGSPEKHHAQLTTSSPAVGKQE